MKNKNLIILFLVIIVIIAIIFGIFIARYNPNYIYNKDGTITDAKSELINHLKSEEDANLRKEQIDFSVKGNCLDNACAENFFGILKSELYYIKEKEYKNIEELEKDIIEYIEYYNNRRIKSKLKGMSPVQYREHSMLVA